jgi:uncharacterized RDD family membrane protein YckC
MERIKVETTQNVAIEYDIASVGDRIIATIIDGLIILGYLIILIILYNSFIKESTPSGVFYFIIPMLIPFIFYHLLCEVFMNGQSFGKKAMKTKVIRIDGRQPTFGNYLLRWVIGLIERPPILLGFISLITVVINGKGQRLGDIAAGTTVIKLRQNQPLTALSFQKVEENYIPVFPEAAHLTDADANTIRQVLRLKPEENQMVLMGKLATKLKEYLHIQSLLDNKKFLETLLRDFNKLNGRL